VPLLDDSALWQAFTEGTLAPVDWTHRTHLRVAFLHARRWPLDEAHLRIRVGIIRLNARHQLEETPTRGYHETLTRAWLALVARAVGSHASSEELLCAHPELLDKDLALHYYSRERLFSPRARAIFVEPDLTELPRV
jgi:hypothetical protein